MGGLWSGGIAQDINACSEKLVRKLKLKPQLSNCLPRPKNSRRSPREQLSGNIAEDSETSGSPTTAPERQNYPDGNVSTAQYDSESSDTRPGLTDIATGIHLYFKYCHRQPIWCFEREEIDNYSSLPHELVCSILCLTARFSNKRDRLQLYGHNVRPLIMLRIANGTVVLETIESLCLLSYSFFIGTA